MLLHSGKVLSFIPFKKGGSDFQMLESGNTMKMLFFYAISGETWK